jgi:RNA polymerase sigma-70 factor (sigma-E family)
VALRSSPLRDTEALTYGDFVAARWTSLYRTAYLLTANHADAEDLVQTALVNVYLSWSKVSGAASPDAYVRRILTNAFLSGRRPLRVSRERLVERPPETALPTPASDDRLVLWPHISALTPRQRAVIVLRYYEDLSEQQIADALGCATGTV